MIFSSQLTGEDFRATVEDRIAGDVARPRRPNRKGRFDMPLCVVNADCWKGCCKWCMAIWEEPDGPCHRTNAHEQPKDARFDSDKITVTANQVPGDIVAEALGDWVPETTGSKLQASDELFCFSLAAVTREELAEALGKLV
jgi:hypothetical protein